MKNLVNRRSKGYHQYRLNVINDLDIIASTVLALTWSRTHNMSKTSQGLIQMDCVACVIVDNEIWLANNLQNISDEDICELRRIYNIDNTIWVVKNGERGIMHAEMQIISQLLQEDKKSTVSYMGVSKPCCKNCSQILDVFNFDYASKHNSIVKNWQSPFTTINY